MEGIYLPLWAALPSYPTRRGTRPPAAVRARGARPHGALTLCGAPFQGTRPAHLEEPGARGAAAPSPGCNSGPPREGGRTSNLGCCRFARRYWGNPGWFLFLRLLICLSSAGSPARSEADAWWRACGRPPTSFSLLPLRRAISPGTNAAPGACREGRFRCARGPRRETRTTTSRARRTAHEFGLARRAGRRRGCQRRPARGGARAALRRRSDGQARRVTGGRDVRSKTRWLAGFLQFAPRIACRRVLHRRRSQEIRCRGLCLSPRGSLPRQGGEGSLFRGPQKLRRRFLQGGGRVPRGRRAGKRRKRVRRARRPRSPL